MSSRTFFRSFPDGAVNATLTDEDVRLDIRAKVAFPREAVEFYLQLRRETASGEIVRLSEVNGEGYATNRYGPYHHHGVGTFLMNTAVQYLQTLPLSASAALKGDITRDDSDVPGQHAWRHAFFLHHFPENGLSKPEREYTRFYVPVPALKTHARA